MGRFAVAIVLVDLRRPDSLVVARYHYSKLAERRPIEKTAQDGCPERFLFVASLKSRMIESIRFQQV